MKTFREHLNEEIKIGALASGGIDIERDAIRDEINGILAGIADRPCVTPYASLIKVRKALAYFHIHLPKKVYLEGRHGVEVWEVSQFGNKMGFTDQGEWINHVPPKYYLFFHYHLVGSMYYLQAKLVDEKELESKISNAEAMVAEEADSATRQAVAKAAAPKEEPHTALGDCDCSQGDSPSTKKAVDVSMKKTVKEGWASIGMPYDRFGDVNSKAKFYGKKPKATKPEKGDDTYKDSKQGGSKVKMAKTVKEEQIDEVSLGKLVRYKNKAGEGREKGLALADKKMKGKAKVNASMPKNAYMEEDKDPCWKGYEMVGMKKKGARQVPNCVPVKEDTVEEGRMPASVIKHKQKLASMTPEEKAKKFAGKSEEQLKSMARRHGYGKDSNEYSKHVKEEQIDELSKKALGSYVKRASVDLYGKGAARGFEVSKGQMDSPAKKKAGNRITGIYRASDKLAKEETQIDEKAPPGAKFERMVKHIKAGYAKDGLSKKEKSIAYATAWKAKKREESE